MKIYMKEKPQNCEGCKLRYEEELSCAGFTKTIDTCCILEDEIIDLNELHKDCPIVELEVKQLEWKNTYNGYKAFFCIYSIECRDGHYIASIKNTPDKYCSTLKEAKQLCQDHYNKLFNEMIGE